MSNIFNDFSDIIPCRNANMCSIDPSSYALEELLLNEIKQISFYTVKLKDFSLENKEITGRAIKALTVIIINTAIRFDDYKNLLLNTQKDKTALKEKYLECCKEKRVKYELVENAYKIPENGNLSTYLRAGENLVIEKQKEFEPKKLGLIELITIFAKTTSINIDKLQRYGVINHDTNFEVLKFLNLTNISNVKIEKLKRKILEFSSIALEIQKKLTEKINEAFGQRIENSINFNIKEGKSILVSGADLDELEQVLIKAKEHNINVYTNLALFKAFLHPKFLEYDNLIAHFGKETPEIDFANFKGPIYTTGNFLQNLDYLMRGTIFTTKIVANNNMVKITDSNLTPLIEYALNSTGFTKEDVKEEDSIPIKFNKDEIKAKIEQDKKPVCVIVGEKKEILEKFKDKNLILLNSPIEDELLFYITENVKKEDLEIVFTNCSATTLNLMFSIIQFANKIYFTRCPNALISPHADEALVNDFNIELI